MRDLKFKAISLDTGKWIYGYGVVLHKEENLAVIIGHVGGNLMQNSQVIPETICQFTGFMDSEGAEVYEGDATENGRVIVWRRGAFWSDQILGEGKFPITFNQEERLDDWITGNIHDK